MNAEITAFQTTVGIPILIVLLRLLTYGFSLTPIGKPPASIQTGNYGRPPKVAWWLKQSFIYFLGLLGMKACVFVIFQLCPWIVRVGDWALKWTEGNETVQVFFVMLFFPVVMNALQYYIIDGFIKDQKSLEHEPFPDQEHNHDDGRVRRPQASGDDERLYDSQDTSFAHSESTGAADNRDRRLPPDRITKLMVHPKNLDEYDPAKDGETTPTISDDVGGSSEERNFLATETKDASLRSNPHP